MTAFSNGSEWDAWSVYWCYRCTKEDSCKILDFVLTENQVPPQWTEVDPRALAGRYVCDEFETTEGAGT
ncbi:MAG TPA: hypothetical protein VK631_14865 [Solirubrobacteraceae bacterium]|nr:hypothetical protein [Solirubrobacteraceae bacterium]